MDAAIQHLVRNRAQHRCEYCHLPQSAAPFVTFHVEHIQAQQHVVDDSPDNLALACPDCNRYKGPNLTTLDSQTRALVRLFNPRQDNWDEHFERRDAIIVGRTTFRWHVPEYSKDLAEWQGMSPLQPNLPRRFTRSAPRPSLTLWRLLTFPLVLE